MIKGPDGVSPKPSAPAEGPSPEAKGVGRTALVFFFGAIAFIIAPKLLPGY